MFEAMRTDRLVQRRVKQLVARTQATIGPRQAPAIGPALSPDAALRQHGFTIFPGLFTPEECAAYASALQCDEGLQEGTKSTKRDVINCFPTAREVLFEGRIIDAVRTAL